MSSETPSPAAVAERPIDNVRGTRDWLPGEYARLAELEVAPARAIRAGRLRAARDPGAGVYRATRAQERRGDRSQALRAGREGTGQGGVCLRPELTAGIVRAYTAAPEPPVLPWRVSHSGAVFRYETPRPDRLREFQPGGRRAARRFGTTCRRRGDLAGRLGAGGGWGQGCHDPPRARRADSGDAPALGPARPAGVGSDRDAQRSRHRGAGRRGASSPAWHSSQAGCKRASRARSPARSIGPTMAASTACSGPWSRSSPAGAPGQEIVHRLRRKWDLGHGLLGALERGASPGPRPGRSERPGTRGPGPARARRISRSLPNPSRHSGTWWMRWRITGLRLDRVELDLGFGRGIGFYSQMIFELIAPTPDGPVEVCGGGPLRRPGARARQRPRRPRGRLRVWPGAARAGTRRPGTRVRAARQPGVRGRSPSARDQTSDAVRLATYLRAKGVPVSWRPTARPMRRLRVDRGRGIAHVVAVAGRLETPGVDPASTTWRPGPRRKSLAVPWSAWPATWLRDAADDVDQHHDRPDPRRCAFQGAPLRRRGRDPQDGRLQGPPRQRPAVRGDDRRASAVPRRLHAADRHRDPGRRRALPPGRHRHGPVRRACRREPSRRW